MAVKEADDNELDELDDAANKENVDDRKAKKSRKLGSPLKKITRVWLKPMYDLVNSEDTKEILMGFV